MRIGDQDANKRCFARVMTISGTIRTRQEVSTAMTSLSETSEKTSRVANDTLRYSGEILNKSQDLIKISTDLENLVSGESEKS